MTDPHRPDLDRDPLLDAAWKAHSTELPPARVDAAILAAAHREARTRPQQIDDDAHARARAPFRAWWGFAAAATIGVIAFGLLQLAPPPDTQQAPIVASDIPDRRSPSPQPSPPKQGGEGGATVRPADLAPRAAMQPEARQQQEARQQTNAPPGRDAAVAAEPAPPRTERALPRAFPAQETPSLAAAAPPAVPPAEMARADAASNALGSRRPESDERSAPAPAAKGGAAAPARTPAAKLAMRTPASWVERIRVLHAEQRFDEATRELNAFRDAYPDADARLPELLQAWAASVARAR